MNNIETALRLFVENNSPLTLGSASLCALPAIEMAIKAIHGIANLHNSNDTDKYNLSANLGGAIFYGLCATNYVPFSAIAGATIFTVYSIVNCKKIDTYVTSQLLGNAIIETGRFIWNAMGKVSEFMSKAIHSIASLIKSIVSPIFEVIIKPVAEAILKIVSGVLNLIALPKHPVWYGVAILAIGIAIKTQM